MVQRPPREEVLSSLHTSYSLHALKKMPMSELASFSRVSGETANAHSAPLVSVVVLVRDRRDPEAEPARKWSRLIAVTAWLKVKETTRTAFRAPKMDILALGWRIILLMLVRIEEIEIDVQVFWFNSRKMKEILCASTHRFYYSEELQSI
jgi:hypothetical protein